jgi:hypothetical protein
MAGHIRSLMTKMADSPSERAGTRPHLVRLQIPPARAEEPCDVQRPSQDFFNHASTPRSPSSEHESFDDHQRAQTQSRPSELLRGNCGPLGAFGSVFRDQALDRPPQPQFHNVPQKRIAGRRLDMLGSHHYPCPQIVVVILVLEANHFEACLRTKSTPCEGSLICGR